MRSWLVVVTLTALLVSGCAGTTPGTSSNGASPPGGLDHSKPIADIQDGLRAAMAGVPCEASVPASVTASSDNLRLLSAIAIPDSADGGIHGELDIRGDLAIHARYGGSGFELYDIRDPLAPKVLGNWTNIGNDGSEVRDGALDVKFSPDNRTVLVGVGNGIHLVDVTDPLHPRAAGNWSVDDAHIVGDIPAVGPLPAFSPGKVEFNAHMFFTKRIAGQDWVFLAPNSNSGVWVLKLEGTPEARSLTYVTQTLPVEGGPLGPHDLYVQKDAMDGHWYLYSSDGFHGWTVFNIDDPASPMVAGGFLNPAELSYTHTIQAAAINGKRIVATIGEVGANFLRVYDASVLAAPILLGVWQSQTVPASPNTGDPTADASATHPEHDINIVDGKLYVSYYSYGMYVFDLKAFTSGPSAPLAGTATLKPMAHWAVGVEPSDGPLAFNGYWDTVLKDGVIYVSHIEGGLVVLGFGCNDAPDPALTSDG